MPINSTIKDNPIKQILIIAENICLDFIVLHSRNQYLMQLGIDTINGISGPKTKFYKP